MRKLFVSFLFVFLMFPITACGADRNSKMKSEASEVDKELDRLIVESANEFGDIDESASDPFAPAPPVALLKCKPGAMSAEDFEKLMSSLPLSVLGKTSFRIDVDNKILRHEYFQIFLQNNTEANIRGAVVVLSRGAKTSFR